MAAEDDDIVKVGITIQSFTKDKEEQIARFVKLFQDLSLIDGKTFNPVMGGSMTEYTKQINKARADIKLLQADVEKLAKLSEKVNLGAKNSIINNPKMSQDTRNLVAGKPMTGSQADKEVTAREEKERLEEMVRLSQEANAKKIELEKAYESQRKTVIANLIAQDNAYNAKQIADAKKVSDAKARVESLRLAKIKADAKKAQEIKAKNKVDDGILNAEIKQIATLESARVAATKENNRRNKKAADDARAYNKEVETARALAIKQNEALNNISVKNKAAIQKKADADLELARKEAIIENKRIDAAAAVSAQNQSNAIKNITGDYQVLIEKMKEQEQIYRDLALAKGTSDPETKEALYNFSKTNDEIKVVNKSLNESKSASLGFGKGLSTIYNQVRILAYILPGLGIAGIFTLAYEAIKVAAEALGFFEKGLVKELEAMDRVNKSANEQFDIFEKLNKQRINFYKNIALPGEDDTTAKDYTDALNIKKAGGIDAVREATEKARIAQVDYNQVLFDANSAMLDPKSNLKVVYDNLGKLLEKERAAMTGTLGKIAVQTDAVAKAIETASKFDPNSAYFSKEKVYDDQGKRIDKDIANANLKVQQTIMEGLQSGYEKQVGIVDRYQEVILARDEAFKAKELKIYQERTALILEQNKKVQENIIATNARIISSDRSKETQILTSLYKTRLAQDELAVLAKEDVDKDKEATDYAKSIAKITLSKQLLTNEIAYETQRDAVITSFYQRKIKALSDMQKGEINSESVKNDKVYKNEVKTLEERLAALNNFIKQQQAIQQVEENLKLQSGKNSKDGIGNLTPEEELQVKKDTEQQKLNLQADAERKFYDIMASFQKRKFDAVRDENLINTEYAVVEYTKELVALNKSYDDKLTSFRDYKIKRKQIDEKYRVEVLDESIAKGESKLANSSGLLIDQERELLAITKQRAIAEVELEIAKGEGFDIKPYLLRYEALLGEEQALKDAITDTQKEVTDNDRTLKADKLEREKRHLDRMLDAHRAYAAADAAIVEALFTFAKTVSDKEAEEALKRIREQQRIREEGLASEKAAVAKSSLSSKSKVALEVQLDAQRIAAQKEAAAKERDIKRRQAMFDRDMTLAKIAWNTQQTISAIYASYAGLGPAGIPIASGLAIRAGILGAIQAATVLAKGIPSFADGVIDFSGGFARYGEDGAEVLKEPGKQPKIINRETISYLSKGTDIIPLTKGLPFEDRSKNSSWSQTRWLAAELKKDNKEIRNIFKPTINVDTHFISYKRNIIGN